jgi:hypothetical protein
MAFPHDRRSETTIRGVTYPSVSAAAEAIGVSADAIRKARRRGALDKVGLNPRGREHGLPVTIDDVTYPSVPKAAKALGMSYWAVRDIALEQKATAK